MLQMRNFGTAPGMTNKVQKIMRTFFVIVAMVPTVSIGAWMKPDANATPV